MGVSIGSKQLWAENLLVPIYKWLYTKIVFFLAGLDWSSTGRPFACFRSAALGHCQEDCSSINALVDGVLISSSLDMAPPLNLKPTLPKTAHASRVAIEED
mmetsp:Transcript_59493/g.133656  ORF Transcript_59493/g.133656 Transcript_59493/m.133656 type:complete len:101 (+) Transcript_59493:1-303(+)